MTKTLQNWSKIPIEILNIITTYCGKDCKKVKWMFVNKLWFTFYLSQVYKTITTSLGDEPVINKILHSPFDIGKHVKSVHLSNIPIPFDLNKLEVRNDILGKIMKRTPNVSEVNFSSTDQTSFQKNWDYFSGVLININCWKLQFIPTLGEDPIVCAVYYYACANHLRHTLRRLALSFGVFGFSKLYHLKHYIALETLEVRERLINGLTDIEKVLQYTPKLKELTVRFATIRVYQPIKKEHAAYSNIKRLRLYNFNPQNNDELLTLVKVFPALESLHIFCEINKIFLSDIDDPSIIDKFFNCINLIPEYKIMMTGETQETIFSEPWLKSIKSSKDILLLYSYSEKGDQNHLKFKSNIVTTFCGGSTRSDSILAHVMKGTELKPKIIEKLKILDSQKISRLKIACVSYGLSISLELILAKERPYLKKITISDCTLEDYAPRKNVASIPQHIKSIIFRNCELDLLLLKSTLTEFNSLNYVEFKGCTFNKNANIKSIDMSDTNVKTIKMINFRKMSSSFTYTDKVQTVIAISVYFATLRLFRYFSVVENNLFETTKHTYKMFCKNFSSNDAVVLNIKVKSLQKLSLKLTDTSKVQNISFRSQES